MLDLHEIRAEGYRVLTREMGAAKAAMFLRQIESGSGDFTQERQSTPGKTTVEEIAARIQARQAQPTE